MWRNEMDHLPRRRWPTWGVKDHVFAWLQEWFQRGSCMFPSAFARLLLNTKRERPPWRGTFLNRDCDVASLCKEFPEHLRECQRKHGDRLPK